MFRLSKTTDYGIVLMAQLAGDAPGSAPDSETSGTSVRPRGHTARNARELAESSDLPVPMVSKILKALAKEGLLVSQRGAKGGYKLARPPEELTVSEMIHVLEGPVALTDCAIRPALCEHETMCAVREPWQLISRVVERALADVTLADLVSRGGVRAARTEEALLQIEGCPEPERSPAAGTGRAG
ncbi:MAG: SUF system Fe-S cluster assembly regulator [Deltaproteobacteria bacterium]|nr:SUF system Fe-S cluster assembly regulator [Deltaproteobacteria bacterium]